MFHDATDPQPHIKPVHWHENTSISLHNERIPATVYPAVQLIRGDNEAAITKRCRIGDIQSAFPSWSLLPVCSISRGHAMQWQSGAVRKWQLVFYFKSFVHFVTLFLLGILHGEIIYGGTRWIEDDCSATFSEYIFLFPACLMISHWLTKNAELNSVF